VICPSLGTFSLAVQIDACPGEVRERGHVALDDVG
jgi:hypothetical protein